MFLSRQCKMKLLVHNFLSSKFLKNVSVGYPLKLTATDVNVGSSEFNCDFIKRMIPKLDYTVLKTVSDSVGHGEELPSELSSDWEQNENLLKVLHKTLMDIDVVEGYLECPETGRKFPIKNGIPNMLANEDEVA